MTRESVETWSKSFIIIDNFIVKFIRNQHLIRILKNNNNNKATKLKYKKDSTK